MFRYLLIFAIVALGCNEPTAAQTKNVVKKDAIAPIDNVDLVKRMILNDSERKVLKVGPSLLPKDMDAIRKEAVGGDGRFKPTKNNLQEGESYREYLTPVAIVRIRFVDKKYWKSLMATTDGFRDVTARTAGAILEEEGVFDRLYAVDEGQTIRPLLLPSNDDWITEYRKAVRGSFPAVK